MLAEIYPAAIKLLQATTSDFSWTRKQALGCRPDCYVFAAIFVCFKLCYGLDDIIRIPKKPNEPCHQIVDWELWASMIRRVWVEDEVFTQPHPHEVVHWDKSKMGRFVDWMEKYYILADDDLLKYERQEHLARVIHLFPRETSALQEFRKVKRESSDNDEDEAISSHNHISKILDKGFYPEKNERRMFKNHNPVDTGPEYDEFEMTLEKELLQIPARPVEDSVHHTKEENPYLDIYPSTSIVTEIAQLVHSTTTSYDVQLTKHESEDEWGTEEEDDDEDAASVMHRKRRIQNATYKGIKIRPGERYPYISKMQTSDHCSLLFEAGRKMCGEGHYVMNQIIDKFEKYFIKMSK